jgi:hypothetical protein
MHKKLHIGYTRLSKKNLDNYIKGKSYTDKQSNQEKKDKDFDKSKILHDI